MAKFYLLRNGFTLQSYLKVYNSTRPTIYATSGGTGTFYCNYNSDARIPFYFGGTEYTYDESTTSISYPRFYASSKKEYDKTLTTVPNKVGSTQTSGKTSATNKDVTITLTITNNDENEIKVNSFYMEENIRTGTSSSIKGLTAVCILDREITIPAGESKSYVMIVDFKE